MKRKGRSWLSPVVGSLLALEMMECNARWRNPGGHVATTYGSRIRPRPSSTWLPSGMELRALLHRSGIFLHSFDQRIESGAAPRAVAQILVHRDPGLQLERERLREHAPQRSVAPGQCDLTEADARAAADQRQ